ncbi:MAG: hypothetical protein WAV18_22680 [Roseiarcus sp.]
MTKEDADGCSRLSQKRVFIVEDKWFLATMLEDVVVELGLIAVGVASKLKDGLVMAEQGQFDFAILDVSLKGQMSHPIADVLEARGPALRFRDGLWRIRRQGRETAGDDADEALQHRRSSPRSTAGLAEGKATGYGHLKLGIAPAVL